MLVSIKTQLPLDVLVKIELIQCAHIDLKFYAGNNLRKLPTCLGTPEYKYHIDWLQKTTRLKLFSLEHQFNIEWFMTCKFPIKNQQRYAILIYGIWNNHLIAYFRKETKCNVSGQSYIYFERGQRIRANVLNDLFLSPHVKYEHSFSNNHWINLIKRLYKLSSNIEFEKYLLLNC